MTKTQEQAIRKHGEQLQAIFPTTIGLDPIKLCKQLRRLEGKANRAACALCSDANGTEKAEEDLDWAERELHKLLGTDVPTFINRDPRGYALKIDDEWMRKHEVKLHQDWGGYGIIAPEINGKGA